jgi:P4 family phage/plasmid primase-like protien
MDRSMNLQKFLVNAQSTTQFTHTGLKGGKYWIPDDKVDQFYDLYSEWILDGHPAFLVEKNTEIGSLRIDFDFIYTSDIKTHQHTREQVIKFCKDYMLQIKEYLEIPENVDIYIMEKRKPTFDEKKNRMKSGIHIVIPSICTTSIIEQSVRRNLLKTMDNYFNNLPLQEKWDRVYDEGVIKRSANWMLYGSKKGDEEALPYMISYILNYKNNEFTIIDTIPPITSSLIKTLSVRKQKSDETPLTQKAREIYSVNNQPLISGGRAVTPSRGRPAQRGEPTSRGSSPHGRIVRILDPDYKDYLKAHIMNLNKERSSDYRTWEDIGQCLFNIHPDLLDVFLDFSSQDSEKYNEAECIQQWNKFTFRNDGDRLSVRSIFHWSRTDDIEGYIEIENTNINRLIEIACSGTEHDVSKVVHAKFRDLYVCSDFGKNVWYRWMGHIWVETDSGVDLQIRLSREIASLFFKKMNEVTSEMSERNLMSCSSIESKGDCGICDYCKLDKSRLGLNKIFTKLKTTSFKNNVMRECRELFFDEKFTKKIDSNKDLIAFNNGVLDLVTFDFRDGKPEDYLSFSTGIDYNPERHYSSYSSWKQIDLFLSQVLPDKEVREYFLKHLSTCIVGGNKTQRFHIMTGSGSNGKSMLMNLTSKSLGDYAAVVPISLFTQKRANSGAAAPEVIRLKGRRFVTMQEPDEKVALNSGLMKQISSGEKMFARDLFKSGIEFEIQSKFHLACNDKPEIHSTDGGTWRRLVVVNFTSKFVEKPTESYHFPIDENIQHAVNSIEWATPFLAYLIHIYKEGHGFQKLVPPPKILEYTTDYRNDNDGIARFITEKIGPSEDDVVTREMLRSTFKQWKNQNEISLLPSDLEKRIVEIYGKYPKGGWPGIRILDN